MKVLFDIILINLSAFAAFLFRENFGDFLVKQEPSAYLFKYLGTLFVLNILYLFLFWILGLYDRRQKRALLEEFILIFGVISIGVVCLVVLLFIGRMWWMSRIVLFSFYGISVILLCLSRVLIKSHKSKVISKKFSINDIVLNLKETKRNVEPVSIVIVTYNSKDNIGRCLYALQGFDDIIVVDNNSSDGTADYIKNISPQIKLIRNFKNFGYAKAVNIGLKQVNSKFCLILNPDVFVIPGATEVMLNYILKHNEVGIAGSRLINEDGTLQYSARRFLDLRTYLYRFTPIRGLMSGSGIERYYLMSDWDHSTNRLVDWVLGGCMMVRMDAMNKIGLFDERFFMYFEDVDLCFKMWESDWQVAYVADSIMIHKHMRASVNKIFNKATREHFKSLFRFVKKHGFRIPERCPSMQEVQ